MRIFRDSLTFLAALLAALLLAVVIAPYWLDWNRYRGDVALLLRDAIGAEMRIQGDMRLRLLPIPEFDADNIEIGPAARPILSAERLTFSLAPIALLRSTIKINAARIDRPVIALDALETLIGRLLADAQANRAPEAGPAKPTLEHAGPFRFSLNLAGSGVDQLSLRGATLLRAGIWAKDTANPLRGLDIEIEAPALLGPIRLDVVDPASGRDFRAQIGTFEAGRARLKGVVEDRVAAFRVTLDGWLGAPGQNRHPLFDGALQFAGNPLIGPLDSGFQLPLEGSARVIARADEINFDPVNISTGSTERGAAFEGQAFVSLAEGRPALRGQFVTRRLDPAALMGREDKAGAARDWLSLWRAGAGAAKTAFPVDLNLGLFAGNVQLSGGLAQDLTLRLNLDSGGAALEEAAITLPGMSRLHFVRERSGEPALIDGAVDFQSQDPAAFLRFARGADAPIGLPASLKLAMKARSDGEGIAFEAVRIASEAGTLTGTVRLDLPEPGKRAVSRVALDLAAPKLDARLLAALDPLRPIQGVEIASRLAVGTLLVDGAELGGLALDLERDGLAASLKQLRLTGREGETFTLSGSASGQSMQLTAKLDAEKLTDLARIGRVLLPGAISDGFFARAESLAPALAIANIRIESKTGEAVWDIAVDGKLGGTNWQAKTRSTFRDNDLLVSLDGEADNPDGARLLAQLTGGAVAPTPDQPGRLRLKAEGNPRRTINGALSGQVAGIDLEANGTYTLFRAQNPFEGRMRLQSRDLAPLHRALGAGAPFVPPGMSARIEGRLLGEWAKLTLTAFSAEFTAPAPHQSFAARGEIAFDFARGGQVAGQLKIKSLGLPALLAPVLGAAPFRLDQLPWPETPFAPGVPPMLSGDLWIEAERGDIAPGIALDQPQFILRFAPGMIAIEGLDARLGDANFSASLTLLRQDRGLDLAGKLGLARVPLPGGAGRISGEIPLTASGASPAAFIRALGGAGRLTVEGLSLPEADPFALSRLLARPLDELGTIDENRIGASLDEDLRKGPLNLPNLPLAATIVNGQMRLVGRPAEGALPPAAAIEVSPALTLDLARGFVDARIGMRGLKPPANWRGATPEIALAWTGRLLDGSSRSPIRRQLQVASLVNGFLAMAIQRDLERAEAFEADIRERAFFNRRRKADAFLQRREREIAQFERAQAQFRAIASEESARLQARSLAAAQKREIEQEREIAETARLAAEEARKRELEAASERKRLEEEARRLEAERKRIELERAAEKQRLAEAERRRREEAEASLRAGLPSTEPAAPPATGTPLDLRPRRGPP